MARPRQTADHRTFDLLRNRLHALEVAGGGDREAGLDHVHPKPRQLLGDLELFLLVQRYPRRLLAVAQRGVEDEDSIRVLATHSGCSAVASGSVVSAHAVRAPSLSRSHILSAGYAATRPPRAIPPEGGAGEASQARSRTTFRLRRLAPRQPTGTPFQRRPPAPSGNRLRESVLPCRRCAARRSCCALHRLPRSGTHRRPRV